MKTQQSINKTPARRVSVPILLGLLAVILITTGCSAGLMAANDPTPTAESPVQIPAEAQAYIEMSQDDLGQRLGIDPEQIELESVTDATAAGGTYIVKLMAEDKLYEYHGRDGEVLLVSEPLPQAPDQFAFAPAAVESVEIQIDESAATPVSVVVRGQLPDNCTEIHEGLVDRVDERTFAVSLSTRRPAGKACGEVLVPYETAVSLGVDVTYLPAGAYTVVVNEQVTETFTLDGTDGADGNDAELPQVSLVLDEAVAAAVTTNTLPAVTETEGAPYWALVPAHVEVAFEGYAHTQSMHRPMIYVYPVDAFSEMNEMAAEQIITLGELLLKKPNLNELKALPFLPFFNAQSMMHVKGQYLTFAGGSGMRYLTQYGQAAGPINNQELFYTFQGLTDDGAYYVAAIFPVAQANLPADMAGADASFPNGYETYIEGVKAELETAVSNSFTPDLTTLDEIIASLSVTP